MRELLLKLREEFSNEYNLQFKVKDGFYNLSLNKDIWFLTTIFGENLKLDTNKLNGLSKEEVKKLLKNKFKDIKIY